MRNRLGIGHMLFDLLELPPQKPPESDSTTLKAWRRKDSLAPATEDRIHTSSHPLNTVHNYGHILSSGWPLKGAGSRKPEPFSKWERLTDRVSQLKPQSKRITLSQPGLLPEGVAAQRPTEKPRHDVH